MSTDMSKVELSRRLRQRRAELRERAQRIEADLRRETDAPTGDAPDLAIQRENEDVLVALGDAVGAEIARIDVALQKLAQTGVPHCTVCGDPIDAARLAIVPEADRCQRCM